MTPNKAIRSAKPKLSKRLWQVGFAASLMLTASPLALHAEISNAELAKEIAELKAQIRSLRGGVAEAKKEARTKKVAVAPAYVAPPMFAAIPPGATPVYATLDKKMIFGALTITPGGFFAAENVFRSKAQNRELESTAQSIPFGAQAATGEDRFSGRQSRAALLLEAPITPSYLVSGYAEIDFQQVGTGSNYVQTSSFVPRVREIYAALDNSDYGFHVLAGQNWSLATINSKGITPRNEAVLPTIDSNFLPGFVYKRQAQIRITKDFDKKLWLSLSVENAQDAYAGCAAPGVNGQALTGSVGVTAVTCNYSGAGSLAGNVVAANGATTMTGANGTVGEGNLTINQVPDIIAKAAYEARLADRDVHLEAYGIFRDINDRAAYAAIAGALPQGTATNYSTPAGGVGFGVIAAVLPKYLDFQGSGLIGTGISSYGAGQVGADATFGQNGAPVAIRGQIFNAGLIAHITPSIDVYGFAGLETYQQSTQGAGATTLGYGSPVANNSGCFNSVTGGTSTANVPTCGGNTKRVWELTGGITDKLYKGQFGEVRVALQYAYQQRELFQGNGGGFTPATGVGALPFAPKQNDQMVYTSLRYYPFQ